MYDFKWLERFINNCRAETYAQPTSEGHERAMLQVIEEWIRPLDPKPSLVLDVGCGWGEFMEVMLKEGYKIVGINTNNDYRYCAIKKPNLTVFNKDMHFMDFNENQFDLVYCRHVAEHSFMPAFLLSELYRITKTWCIVIVPPESIGVDGQNHYSILHEDLWKKLMTWVGFEIVEFKADVREVVELRYLLRKV